MTHLQESEFIDALEGTLPAARAAHLAGCDACRAKAEALRSSFATAASTEVPEPSPLFWDHFASRINARIDAPPQRAPWFAVPRLAFVALAALAVMIGFYVKVAPGGRGASAPTPTATAIDLPVVVPELDDLDADPEWAIVRAAADGLDVEDAQAEGLTTRPGTADRIALELSEAERAELLRLIQSEIKTGA